MDLGPCPFKCDDEPPMDHARVSWILHLGGPAIRELVLNIGGSPVRKRSYYIEPHLR